MYTRRDFIKKSAAAGMFISFAGVPAGLINNEGLKKVTILHTNDTHSRLEPFEADHPKYANKGGVANRAVLVEEIRKQEKNVLLLDAGDIFQGTPYFNFYKGELNFKLMSMLKYDAATLGNHDFDNGIDGFESQLHHCNFPFLICNYDLSNTVLNGKVEKYKIFEFDGVKIGVTGVGIELDGLVDPRNYDNVIYQDPVEKAEEMAKELKEKHNCSYVIVLSHLGYKYKRDKVSDVVLAKNTENIDLIIGGHTHTFMEEPDIIENKKGEKVTVVQAGFAGIKLGRLDLYFSEGKKVDALAFNQLDVNENGELA